MKHDPFTGEFWEYLKKPNHGTWLKEEESGLKTDFGQNKGDKL